MDPVRLNLRPAAAAAGPNPLAVRFAAVLSTLGHPFVLVPLAVILAGLRTLPPRQLALVVGCTAAALIVETTYILRRVRSGHWSNFDVSVRSQRPRLFLSALLLSWLCLLILWRAGLPTPVLRGVGAAIATLSVAMLCNLRLKVSLHVTFDVYAALLAGPAGAPATAALLCAAAAVGWSRVVLGRHTRMEVLAGAVLGLLGGFAAISG